jgi:hypothetical protein
MAEERKILGRFSLLVFWILEQIVSPVVEVAKFGIKGGDIFGG